jgi:multidrug efflux system membrane fusion protein
MVILDLRVHHLYHTVQFINVRTQVSAMNTVHASRNRFLLPRAAIVFGAFALAACGGAPVEEAARPAIVVQPAPATGGLLDSYAGSLRPRHESALGFQVGGKVARRRVDVGDQVREGQVLAELDRVDLDLDVGAAEANLASAEADAALAVAELARHEELQQRKLVSQSALDARRSTAQAASARVRQAQAQLDAVRNAASYAALRAPVAGVVTQVAVEAGQVVAAGAPLITIAQAGGIEALINVPEGRVGAFAVGMPVRVALWADSGLELAGEVREIAPEADPRTRTFDVRVSIPELPESAQLGMTARVLLVDAAGGGLGVPLSAVTEIEGQAIVWRVDPATSKVSPAPVEVTMWGSESALLASGVDADDWIVAVGVHKLVEDQAIRPIDAQNRTVDLR